MNDKIWRWLNLLGTIAVIAINALANALPLNGQGTGEISDRFNVFFTPAGYVFAIWGLIYLALLAFSIYQLLPAQADNPRLKRIGPLYVLSCLANITWLFLWHYNSFPLTEVAMLALLFCLIAIYLRLETGRSRVSAGESLLARVPFSIYLGWVTVATIANTTIVLNYLGWNGEPLSPQLWTAIVLAAGVVIGALMAFTRRDVAYLLVFVWAFTGIAARHGSAAPLVTTSAYVAAAAVLVLLAAGLVFGYKPRPQTAPAR